jgi:hypothetical protein
MTGKRQVQGLQYPICVCRELALSCRRPQLGIFEYRDQFYNCRVFLEGVNRGR